MAAAGVANMEWTCLFERIPHFEFRWRALTARHRRQVAVSYRLSGSRRDAKSTIVGRKILAGPSSIPSCATADAHRTLAPRLGRHNDDASGRSIAVECGSWTAEHLDAFDVFRKEVVQTGWSVRTADRCVV